MLKIAHRGASAYEAENSMAAFNKAVELGVDFIEADVQLTKDNIPVIRHDSLLDRTTNLTGYIHDYTFAELSNNAVLSNGERIPSLSELCEFISNRPVNLYIDLKAFGKEEIVLNTTLEILPEEKFIIGAFHSEVIKNIKQLNSKVTTVLIIEGNLINLEQELKNCMCDIVAFGFDAIDETQINRVHDLHKKVFTWTVNDPREIERARQMGVDGITGNYPDRI